MGGNSLGRGYGVRDLGMGPQGSEGLEGKGEILTPALEDPQSLGSAGGFAQEP